MSEFGSSTEKILKALKHRKWLSIHELVETGHVPDEMVIETVDFLAKFEFIELDSQKRRARIDDFGLKLLELKN